MEMTPIITIHINSLIQKDHHFVMSPSRSSGADLECCLHGRGCRAGTKQVKVEEEKQNEGEDEEEYAKSEEEKSSRKDQALERLARQLRYVEEFKERREKRREERAKRREERRMSKKFLEKARASEIDDSTSPKQSESESACCENDGTVDVRLTHKKEKSTGRGAKEIKCEKTEESPKANSAGDAVDNAARSIYLGICNFAKAERNVEKRADFKLYHEMKSDSYLDDLEAELVLTLVYKTANGSYRHYPIRKRCIANSTYFYVESEERRPVYHLSLNHLVRYHQINAQRHPEHKDYADPFPWWEVPS